MFAFLSGGAAVCKSVEIRAVYQAYHRFLCGKEGDNPEECLILLCATTGKAAYNINGWICHSALKFQVNNSYYKRPSCDVLKTLQCKHQNLSVLIIDEVSMDGNKMLKTFISGSKTLNVATTIWKYTCNIGGRLVSVKTCLRWMDLLRLAECPRGTWLEFMTRVFHNA